MMTPHAKSPGTTRIVRGRTRGDCLMPRSEYKQRWAEENRDRTRAAQRRYQERHAERLKERRREERERNPGRAEERVREWRERYPERYRAQTALNNAIRLGNVQKAESCEDCGDTVNSRNLQGHHPDYSKPLEVEWLCRGCHGMRHRKCH